MQKLTITMVPLPFGLTVILSIIILKVVTVNKSINPENNYDDITSFFVYSAEMPSSFSSRTVTSISKAKARTLKRKERKLDGEMMEDYWSFGDDGELEEEERHLQQIGSQQSCEKRYETTFDDESGSYGHIFSIRSAHKFRDIVVTGFEFYSDILDEDVHYKLYTRDGSYYYNNNNNNNNNAQKQIVSNINEWSGGKPIAEGTIRPNGPGLGTPLPEVFNLPLYKGSVRSFYFTLTKPDLRYSYGFGKGSGGDDEIQQSNADIEIWEGLGVLSYPLSNIVSTGPRLFLGALKYEVQGYSCDKPTAPPHEQTRIITNVQATFFVEHSNLLGLETLLSDINNSIKSTLSSLLQKDGGNPVVYSYYFNYGLSLMDVKSFVIQGDEKAPPCISTSGQSVCSIIDTVINLVHTDSVSSIDVKEVFVEQAIPPIISSFDYKTQYIGTQYIKSIQQLVLVGVTCTMNEDEQALFTSSIYNLFQTDLQVKHDISLVDVTIRDQTFKFGSMSRLRQRSLQVTDASQCSDNKSLGTNEITLVYRAGYRPPPEKDLNDLVRIPIDSTARDLINSLKARPGGDYFNKAYFVVPEGLSVDDDDFVGGSNGSGGATGDKSSGGGGGGDDGDSSNVLLIIGVIIGILAVGGLGSFLFYKYKVQAKGLPTTVETTSDDDDDAKSDEAKGVSVDGDDYHKDKSKRHRSSTNDRHHSSSHRRRSRKDGHSSDRRRRSSRHRRSHRRSAKVHGDRDGVDDDDDRDKDRDTDIDDRERRRRSSDGHRRSSRHRHSSRSGSRHRRRHRSSAHRRSHRRSAGGSASGSDFEKDRSNRSHRDRKHRRSSRGRRARPDNTSRHHDATEMSDHSSVANSDSLPVDQFHDEDNVYNDNASDVGVGLDENGSHQSSVDLLDLDRQIPDIEEPYVDDNGGYESGYNSHRSSHKSRSNRSGHGENSDSLASNGIQSNKLLSHEQDGGVPNDGIDNPLYEDPENSQREGSARGSDRGSARGSDRRSARGSDRGSARYSAGGANNGSEHDNGGSDNEGYGVRERKVYRRRSYHERPEETSSSNAQKPLQSQSIHGEGTRSHGLKPYGTNLQSNSPNERMCGQDDGRTAENMNLPLLGSGSSHSRRREDDSPPEHTRDYSNLSNLEERPILDSSRNRKSENSRRRRNREQGMSDTDVDRQQSDRSDRRRGSSRTRRGGGGRHLRRKEKNNDDGGVESSRPAGDLADEYLASGGAAGYIDSTDVDEGHAVDRDARDHRGSSRPQSRSRRREEDHYPDKGVERDRKARDRRSSRRREEDHYPDEDVDRDRAARDRHGSRRREEDHYPGEDVERDKNEKDRHSSRRRTSRSRGQGEDHYSEREEHRSRRNKDESGHHRSNNPSDGERRARYRRRKQREIREKDRRSRTDEYNDIV